MFLEKDYKQIESRGIKIDEIYRQIELFKKGVPYVNIAKPATIHDGIIPLSEKEIADYIQLYESYRNKHKILKFVPASGAATRMFKDLYAYLDESSFEKFPSVKQVIDNIKQFAFYEDVKETLQRDGLSIEQVEPKIIIEYILHSKGLNYGSLPKAFIKFHNYSEGARTSFEEHLVEGALYATSADNVVFIHFTLSPEHIQYYENLKKSKLQEYVSRFNVQYELSYSIQSPSTDTIAVDLNNEPFRTENGSLLFRPAGHGALIHNLNNLDADIIFIKNIDNVLPDALKTDTEIYKKALAGLLITIQDKLYDLQIKIESDNANSELFKEINTFYQSYFHFNPNVQNIENARKLLFRPLRVCGMVKNQGEPGGGPFWVYDENQSISLQIVESSQINLSDQDQKNKFKSSTHFNPVDLVCSIKNYKGEKYNLLHFVDPDTSFISSKTKDGKPIKALELPGLWNGAMANWNTIFVEVPITTFCPVKTINDLLRNEHLNK